MHIFGNDGSLFAPRLRNRTSGKRSLPSWAAPAMKQESPLPFLRPLTGGERPLTTEAKKAAQGTLIAFGPYHVRKGADRVSRPQPVRVPQCEGQGGVSIPPSASTTEIK